MPLNVTTTAPTAVFVETGSAPIPPTFDITPAAVPEAKPPAPRITVETVANTFAEMGYHLNAVLAGEDPVPRIILASIPAGLGDIRQIKERKVLFFQTILPLVLKVNEEILRERKRLRRVRSAKAMGRKLSALDRLWISVICDKYKVPRGDLDALLTRIDIIPPSIALAQAAEESGWGTSRFVREGNAIFGQWTYSSSHHGLKPKERGDGQIYRVRTFANLLDSVRAYALNLNTHRAYREFRKTRAELRMEDKPLTSRALLPTLSAYSQRGDDYLQALRQIIDRNDLARADDVHLRDRDDDSDLTVAGESAPASPVQTAANDDTL